jgi:hypothetical protein
MSALIALHVVSHACSTSAAALSRAPAACPNAFTFACAVTLPSNPVQLVGVPVPSVALQPAPETMANRPIVPTVKKARFKLVLRIFMCGDFPTQCDKRCLQQRHASWRSPDEDGQNADEFGV